MEDLFGAIIVIIGIIGSIVSSAKKEKEKKVAEERRRAAAAQRVQAAQKKQTMSAAPAAPAPQPASMLPPLTAADIPVQVITPTVHAHIEPDCDTHDAPGSLGAASPEGKDPCHEDQLRSESSFPESVQQQEGLTFDWSGESMVKAFVMQEVLTRPCQRRAR